MIYPILYVSFVLLFLYDLIKKKESSRTAAVMGMILFLLVALRSTSTGPDTFDYITLYRTGIYGNDYRIMEGLYLLWNSLWSSLYFSDQMFLAVTALASVGMVILVIWKSSRQRVWSYALFLVCFSWYFYLSGMRQGLAMGCFTMGVYLLNKNIDFISLKPDKEAKEGKSKAIRRELGKIFNKGNIGALALLFLAPLFHTTALYAIGVLLLVLVFRGNRTFYMIAISVSFIIVLTGVFKSAEQLVDRAFMLAGGGSDISDRYASYLNDDYIYDEGIYLILKSNLPLNFIALMALFFRKRDFRMKERLYFWMVIMNNLFFYFFYMFRMNMYLCPFACIAVADLLYPVLRKKNLGVVHIIMAIFVLLSAYVSYKNLVAQPAFDYSFCF